MFINQHGPTKDRDPNLRRVINLHLSKVASERRRIRDLVIKAEKLDRSTAQRRRRAREASELKKKSQQQEGLTQAAFQLVRQEKSLSTDLLAPHYAKRENKLCLQLSYEFICAIYRHDLSAMGYPQAVVADGCHALLPFIYEHEIILSVLALYRLCCLPAAEIAGSDTRKMIDVLRSQTLLKVNEHIAAKQVGDVLIFAISILILVDVFLRYTEFTLLHRKGLETMVEMSGGSERVGSTIKYSVARQTLRMFLASARYTMNLSDDAILARQRGLLVYDPLLVHRDIDILVRDLPVGFQSLAKSGYLSRQTIEALKVYQGRILEKIVKLWPIIDRPQVLSDFERCIFVCLKFLIMDISYLGDQASTTIWRKTRQRAEEILAQQHLWTIPELSDCFFWIGTVITTPTRTSNTPRDIREQFQGRILSLRPDLQDSTDVEMVLERFFLPSQRQIAFKEAWTIFFEARNYKLWPP